MPILTIEDFLIDYQKQYGAMTTLDINIMTEWLIEKEYIGESLNYILETIIKKHAIKRMPTYQEYTRYIEEQGYTGKSNDFSIDVVFEKTKNYSLKNLLKNCWDIRNKQKKGLELTRHDIDYLFYWDELLAIYYIMKEDECNDTEIDVYLNEVKNCIIQKKKYKYYERKNKVVLNIDTDFFVNLNIEKRIA